MLAAERHRKILDHIRADGILRTTEVARELGVTEETVRRDFEVLEKGGHLSRVHGGVIGSDAARFDLPLPDRESMNVEAKESITRRAVEEIRPGDTILLDASSTALLLSSLLPDIPLTVLTNSLTVAERLGRRPAIRTVLTGGVVDTPSRSLTGPLVDLALKAMNVQIAFLSCRGIDARRGLSEATEEHARIKARMIELSERTILLADHSKFGLRSAFFFGRLGQVDTLITDRRPDRGFWRNVTQQPNLVISTDN